MSQNRRFETRRQILETRRNINKQNKHEKCVLRLDLHIFVDNFTFNWGVFWDLRFRKCDSFNYLENVHQEQLVPKTVINDRIY